jgi:hypothetical protein
MSTEKRASLRDLITVNPAYTMNDLVGILGDRTTSLATRYPYETIEEVQGIIDETTKGPEDEIVSVFNKLRENFDETKSNDETMAMYLLLQRLEVEPNAVNWLTHAAFCEQHVAGNDQHLVDLIIGLPIISKISLVCAVGGLLRSPLLALRYGPYVDLALNEVSDACSRPGVDKIANMPVNFMLNFHNPSMLNAENGRPGYSTVILNASPINTLPRALLHTTCYIPTSKPFVTDETLQRIMRGFKAPTELVVNEACYLMDTLLTATSTSTMLREAIADRSKGTLTFEDLVDLEWNNQYPVITTQFSDIQCMSYLLDGKTVLDWPDIQQLSKAMSKIFAYATPDGIDNDFMAQLMIELKPCYDEDLIQSPDRLGLHNFSHYDGDFGVHEIDSYIKANHDIITGSYLSRYSSIAAHTPEMGERLLNYLSKLYSGCDNPDHMYHYALVKMALLTLKRAEEFDVFDPKNITLYELVNESGMGSDGFREAPWAKGKRREIFRYDPDLVAKVYEWMPESLKSADHKLFLGGSLAPAELEQATGSQQERSLINDLGI